MANNKKTLYVGGLAENVDRNILKSAFLPFGDIVDINLPMDYTLQKHKGFAFIEFQLPEDAADAIDNMDYSEILGKKIRVNTAKPVKFKDSHNKPIWSDDQYLRKVMGEDSDSDQQDTTEENHANELADMDTNVSKQEP